MAEIDPREFRNALGAFASGVTVITCGTEPNFIGMTAQSFSSLSLEPPLVLVCVTKTASSMPTIKEERKFSVNVLGKDQEEVSGYFATSSRPAPPEQFKEILYTKGPLGTPHLAQATTVFDCTVWEIFDGGDHEIVVGEVQSFEHKNDHEPLLFYRGRYRELEEVPSL